jgi:hypothetical protein
LGRVGSVVFKGFGIKLSQILTLIRHNIGLYYRLIFFLFIYLLILIKSFELRSQIEYIKEWEY